MKDNDDWKFEEAYTWREVSTPKLVLLLLVLFLLLYGVNKANAADLPESAIVSFNSTEQLAATTNSIVGVCDTVGWEIPPDIDINWHFAPSESQQAEAYRKYGIPTITCRELVCVTVVTHREVKYPHYYDHNLAIEEKMEPVVSPGKAIIFYEEVKCTK